MSAFQRVHARCFEDHHLDFFGTRDVLRFTTSPELFGEMILIIGESVHSENLPVLTIVCDH